MPPVDLSEWELVPDPAYKDTPKVDLSEWELVPISGNSGQALTGALNEPMSWTDKAKNAMTQGQEFLNKWSLPSIDFSAYGDELLGYEKGVQSWLKGGEFTPAAEAETARIRGDIKQMQENTDPLTYALAGIAPHLVPALFTGGKTLAPTATEKVAVPIGARIVQSAKTNALLGALLGYGQGEGGAEERARTAVEGGLIGTVAGPVLEEGLRGGGRAIKGAYNLATNPKTWTTAGGAAIGGATGGIPGAVVGGVAGSQVPKLTAANVEKAAIDKFTSAAGDDVVAQLATALENPKGLTQYQTAGELLNNPQLAALERSLWVTNPTNEIGQRFSSNEMQRQATRDALLDVLMQGEGTSDDVARAVQQRYGEFSNAINQRVSKADEAAQMAMDSLGQGRSADDAGKVLAEALQGKYDDARGATRAAYQETGGQLPLLKSKMEAYDIMKEVYGERLDLAAPEVRNMFRELVTSGVGTNRLNLKEADILRREMMNKASIAGRAGDRTSAGVLQRLAGTINNAEERALLVNETMSPEQYSSLQLARELRKQQGQMFEQGAVGQALKTKAYGERAVTDSEIPAKFFHANKGNVEDTAQLIKSLGGEKEAQQALQDYAVSTLRAMSPSGQLKADQFSRWVKRYEGSLKQFPELYEKMSSAEKAQRLLETTSKRATTSIKEVEKSAIGAFLNKDPDKAITSILSSKNPVQQIKLIKNTIKNDPLAQNGLRRSFANVLKRRAQDTTEELTNSGMQRFLKDNGEVLAEVFEPEHLKNIQTVADDLMSQAKYRKLANLPSKGGSPTIQLGSAAGEIIETVAGNRTTGMFTALSSATKKAINAMHKDRVNQVLLDLSMNDPSMATKLASKATPKNIDSIFDRIAKEGLADTPRVASVQLINALSRKDRPAEDIGMRDATGQTYLTPQALKREEAMKEKQKPAMSLLDAIESAESDGDINALSPKGARGAYQFMDATGKEYHRRLGIKEPYDSSNKAQQRKLAEAYLSDLLTKYEDERIAIAGYNYGEPKLDKVLNGNTSARWEDVVSLLPKETRNYVPKVINRLKG
jgi:hypothetical protein